MKISEAMQELARILNERGDLPISLMNISNTADLYFIIEDREDDFFGPVETLVIT